MTFCRQRLFCVWAASMCVCAGCAAPGDGRPRTLPALHPVFAGAGLRIEMSDGSLFNATSVQRVRWVDRVLYGPDRDDATMFRNPQGMTVGGETLYVCDQGVPDVLAVDLRTRRIRSWIQLEDRPACPVDVAVDESGMIYVADTTLSKVLRYDRNGHLVDRWMPEDVAEGEFRPCSLLMANGVLYIGDAGTHRVHRVRVEDGEWLADVTSADDALPMIAPTGMARCGDGIIYIADAVQAAVHRVDSEGNWLAALGTRGRGPGQFVRPLQVACTESGYVLVTDAGRQTVVVFDSAGAFITEIPSSSGEESPSNRLTLPSGVTALSSKASAALHDGSADQSAGTARETCIVSDLMGSPSLRVMELVKDNDGS